MIKKIKALVTLLCSRSITNSLH